MKTFEAKFSNKCITCKAMIKAGDMINWEPGRASHVTCPEVTEAPQIVTIVQGPVAEPSFDLREFPVGGRGKGYAAIATDSGDETIFFRIDRPKDGRWAGYAFVRWVYGEVERRIASQNPSGRVTWYDPRDEDRFDFPLSEIASNPEPAMQLYGQKIGRCACCHKQLTDETSRARGIGPECWKWYSVR